MAPVVGGVQGGALRRPSTNQRATSEEAAARPIRPCHGEKGSPRDVTTPLGQSTDLPLVLALGEGEERFCVPKPVNEERHTPRHRGSAEGGGRIKGQAPFFACGGFSLEGWFFFWKASLRLASLRPAGLRSPEARLCGRLGCYRSKSRHPTSSTYPLEADRSECRLWSSARLSL